MPLGRRDPGHPPCELPGLKTKRFYYPPLVHVDQATRPELVQRRAREAGEGVIDMVGRGI
ncbi:hypothetical protein [Streptomyces sp. NPDC058739]|uniref:hypothetical protein n=1 Tax=Streptomyces sp. NPDC058739 TaxID=3346618 RepID=UPI0036A39922